MVGFIYKITNPMGMIYIGQTTNLSNRICAYRNLNNRDQKILFNSIKKYGWDSHEFTILGEYSIDNLNFQEIHFIKEYNSFHTYNSNGMNLTLGGDGNRGRKDTPETKLKRSIHHIGKKRTEETKKLMSLAKKGKIGNRLGSIINQETKEKISLSKKGKKQTIDVINTRVDSMKKRFLETHGAILQYDKNTNVLLKEWVNTPAGIMKETGFDDSSIIKCLKNKRPHAFNFIWKYKF
jgi:group I intron endonuclease